MKGSIVKCCAEMVNDYYGGQTWKEILQQSGQKPNMLIRPISDIDDQIVFKIFGNICTVLNLSKQQLYDMFGDYWVRIYAPKISRIYYIQNKTAKEFIMGMDKVHEHVTSMIPNAHPPKFKVEEVDENTIIVNYISKRNLIDLYMGLVKGVGNYFKTPIGIKKLSEDRVELTFG
ncbi:MAG: heme NO-binding domain-containing protein [Bacteroidetes bacterium]|nr:heme NO-binding domain-containing protein [Bacteroidota bacterium]